MKKAFTVVELLIVIVVIAILAAITIVAYNGVQDRARESSIAVDFSNNVKAIKIVAALTGGYPTTLEMQNAESKLAASSGLYTLVTYCSGTTGYVLAAQSVTGSKYYSKNGSQLTKDSSIDVTNPCPGQSISSSNRTFLGMSATSCATEGTGCTFNGPAAIAYGRLDQGKFTVLQNQTSPITCSNTTFGDPASGYTKACYILRY